MAFMGVGMSLLPHKNVLAIAAVIDIYAEFLDDMMGVWAESARVLRPNGTGLLRGNGMPSTVVRPLTCARHPLKGKECLLRGSTPRGSDYPRRAAKQPSLQQAGRMRLWQQQRSWLSAPRGDRSGEDRSR